MIHSAPPLFLHGGGRTPDPSLWRPFLAAAGREQPRVAVVVLADDGPEEAFARWDGVLAAAGAGPRAQVVVSEDTPLAPAALADCNALLIAHGLTPGYAAAVAPHAADLRGVLAERGLPVGGSSAGAAVLAEQAVVGGWRLDGRAVCAEEAGEDLDELSAVPGLGLLPLAVDVHAAQWGTLSRLVAAVAAGLVPGGVALDEETVLQVPAGQATASSDRGSPRVGAVLGAGHAWWLASAEAPVRVLRAGDELTV